MYAQHRAAWRLHLLLARTQTRLGAVARWRVCCHEGGRTADPGLGAIRTQGCRPPWRYVVGAIHSRLPRSFPGENVPLAPATHPARWLLSVCCQSPPSCRSHTITAAAGVPRATSLRGAGPPPAPGPPAEGGVGGPGRPGVPGPLACPAVPPSFPPPLPPGSPGPWLGSRPGVRGEHGGDNRQVGSRGVLAGSLVFVALLVRRGKDPQFRSPLAWRPRARFRFGPVEGH